MRADESTVIRHLPTEGADGFLNPTGSRNGRADFGEILHIST